MGKTTWSRRDEQARLTRLAVIETAHRLFVEGGYAATSIRAVAVEAGVSEQTVYRIFGDKVALLRAVVLTAVGGPDDAQPLRQSDRMAVLAAAPTPAARLAMVADWARESYERGLADLENIVLSAAASDDRARGLFREMAEQRYEDTRSLVIAIVGGDIELAPAELDEMVDYLYAVESTPVYTSLTEERGWTTDRYITWFVRLVERLLLDRLADSRSHDHGSRRRRGSPGR